MGEICINRWSNNLFRIEEIFQRRLQRTPMRGVPEHCFRRKKPTNGCCNRLYSEEIPSVFLWAPSCFDTRCMEKIDVTFNGYCRLRQKTSAFLWNTEMHESHLTKLTLCKESSTRTLRTTNMLPKGKKRYRKRNTAETASDSLAHLRDCLCSDRRDCRV